MSRYSIATTAGAFRRAFAVLAAANACATAVEGGRRPSNRDLEALGIEGRSWDRIGRN